MLPFLKWAYIAFKLKNGNKLQFKKQEGKSFCSDKLILKVLIGDFVIDVPCNLAFKIISDIDWVTLVNTFQFGGNFLQAFLVGILHILPFPQESWTGLFLICSYLLISHIWQKCHTDKNSVDFNPSCPKPSNEAPSKSQKNVWKSQEEFKWRDREEIILIEI